MDSGEKLQRHYFRLRWKKGEGLEADSEGLGVAAVVAIAILIIVAIAFGYGAIRKHTSVMGSVVPVRQLLLGEGADHPTALAG